MSIEKLNEYKKLSCEHKGSITFASGRDHPICDKCNEPLIFLSLMQYKKLTPENIKTN